MCIAVDCEPDCDVISRETNLILLIKLFFYMTKKLRQKFKYLENETSFKSEIKSSIFIIFKGLSNARACVFNVTIDNENKIRVSQYLKRKHISSF